MQTEWFVLLPPLIVLLLAAVTRNVIWSLLAGIATAAFIAARANPLQALYSGLLKIVEETQILHLLTWQGSFDHLYVFAFLLCLSILISLLTYTGAVAAYGALIKNTIKDRRSAETASLLISSCFFLDDYFNSLTTGCIMRPIADKFHIARVKLAFLLDAMSSSLCVIVPISSWTAMILVQLEAAGVTDKSSQSLVVADPFVVYLQSLPFAFYPFIIIAAAWFIVRNRISFGPMYVHEHLAQTSGDLYGGKEPLCSQLQEQKKGSLFDFFFPLFLLITLVFCTIFYSGVSALPGKPYSLLAIVRHADIFFSLFFAASTTLFISILYFLYKRNVTLNALPIIAKEGFMLIKNSLIIILLAWTFSRFLKDDLRTGEYLAQLFIGSLPSALLPLLFFITSCLIAATAGSSWGTIAVMFPLALPMTVTFAQICPPLSVSQVMLIFPAIGAILSGAIAGAHLSPISDATVMASISAGAYHIDHVRTQFLYVISVIFGCLVAFILAGLSISFDYFLAGFGALGIGCLIALTLLWLANKKAKNAKSKISMKGTPL